MISSPTSDYQKEIRGYLLGRLEANRQSGSVEEAAARALPTAPILDWWLFEGKEYVGLARPLAYEWARIDRQARWLLATHNPHWRSSRNPEGDVDWIATAFASATTVQAEYVCRTSRIGLSEDEREALEGWKSWIAARWSAYERDVGRPEGCAGGPPWAYTGEVSPRQLQRWAHTARRSRWPLLRNVIAESLRLLFEPDTLDRLPLPADHARVFELLCLVRLLRHFHPAPGHIRWLDLAATGNEVAVRGLSARFQLSISREDMLATLEFGGGLREAVVRHDVGIPRQVDILVLFETPWRGFRGFIIEAKSGGEEYRAAIFQLKCYRAALARRYTGRFIVWGVVEQDVDAPATQWALRTIGEDTADSQEDLWLFTPAAAISNVLRSLTNCDGRYGRGVVPVTNALTNSAATGNSRTSPAARP